VNALFFVVFFVIIVFLWRALSPNKNKLTKPVPKRKPSSTITHLLPDSPDQIEPLPRPVPELLASLVLRKESDLNSAEQAHLTTLIGIIEQPAPLFSQLLGRTFEAKELFDLIKSDAKTSAKVLASVNSSRYGLRHEISNINHAINYLGVVVATNIALSMCIEFNYKGWGSAQRLAYSKASVRGQLASELTFFVAQQLRLEEVAELSTASLFSYLGDQALIASNEQAARQYLKHKNLLTHVVRTQKKCGLNGAIIASNLVREWGVPASLVSHVEGHLTLLNTSFESAGNPPTLGNVICYLCCRIADVVLDNPDKPVADILSVDMMKRDDLYAFYQLKTDDKYLELFELLDKASFVKGIAGVIKKNNTNDVVSSS